MPSNIIGIEIVQANILGIFKRRGAALYALCLYWAAKALQDFQERQAREEFWTNQTSQAMDRVRSKAFKEGQVVGFLLEHGVYYGVYLEFAKAGKNAALWPVMKGIYKPFMEDVKELYGARR